MTDLDVVKKIEKKIEHLRKKILKLQIFKVKYLEGKNKKLRRM